MSGTTTDYVLRDRAALVTGAGRGIGRRIAVGLAAMGAHVALLARSENELGEAIAEIQANGGIATAIVSDIRDADRLRVGVDRVRAELGPPVVLVKNPAVVAPLGPTEALDATEVAAAVAVNIVAPICLSAMLLPGMTAVGWGRIVNISSGIAATPASSPGMTVYAASKAALEAHPSISPVNWAARGSPQTSIDPVRSTRPCSSGSATNPSSGSAARLHDRFAAMHAGSRLISPERSARSLLDRIVGPQTGHIWSVDDSPR